MQRILWLTLAIILGGCAPPANPPRPPTQEQSHPAPRPIDDLLELMRDRLLIQHEVARYKWHARLAITDAKREQQLLEKAEAQARSLGVDPGFAREFFQAQMQAGKLVQQGDFDAWQQPGKVPPAADQDLKALRLQIDTLNRKLLHRLKDAGPVLRDAETRKAVQDRAAVILQGKGITVQVRQTACAPLLGP